MEYAVQQVEKSLPAGSVLTAETDNLPGLYAERAADRSQMPAPCSSADLVSFRCDH